MRISTFLFVAQMCLVILPESDSKSTTANIIGKALFLAHPILENIYKLWHLVVTNQNLEITQILTQDKEQEIIGQLMDLNYKVSALNDEVGGIADVTTSNLLRVVPKIIEMELALHEFSQISTYINYSFEKLQSYVKKIQRNSTLERYENEIGSKESETRRELMKGLDVDRDKLIDFATWNIRVQYNSVESQMNRLQSMVMPDTPGSTGILNLILESSQEMHSEVCNLKESPHQAIYNLYNAIALTQLKGMVIAQFSYMLLDMYKQGNFSAEANMSRVKYEENARKQEENVKRILKNAERGVYRCDPKQHVEGVTYEKLTKLIQGYIENEVNLNPYGTCGENCAFYEYTEYNGCYKKQFCAHQPPCRGKILNCRFVDSDMKICRSSAEERRYDWVQYENGKVLGNQGVCEARNQFLVDSWWRYLFWHCSYCLCLCDDNHNSDRYFNLRDVTADVHENKVVTGLRFVKNNHIVHIQIQQGVLGPEGIIAKGTVSWKPVDNYTVDDSNVESNVDYHSMSWFERAIDVDDVVGQGGHAVTGVRFRKLGSHLNLEARMTPIDFATGRVFSREKSYWQGNDNTDASLKSPRSEIKLTNPDIPIRKGPHLLNSQHDQFLQFQASSFDTDVAQSTVPFIDSQMLTSKGFVISGVGLMHRGKTGSGGFIAPKLISYDFTEHFDADGQE